MPKALGGRDLTAEAELAALTPAAPPSSSASPEIASAEATDGGVAARPIVRVEILDGLRFPDGVLHNAEKPIEIYARVPKDWVTRDGLTPWAKSTVLAKMYGGPLWEKGNSDGSVYVVRSFSSRILTAEEIARPIWARATSSTWFYDTLPNNTLETRGPNFGPPLPPKAPKSFDQP